MSFSILTHLPYNLMSLLKLLLMTSWVQLVLLIYLMGLSGTERTLVKIAHVNIDVIFLYTVNMFCSSWLINKAALA